MAEQPFSSDRQAASVLSAPPKRAPPEMPQARRRLWSGITLVRLAVLIAAGVIAWWPEICSVVIQTFVCAFASRSIRI